MNHSFQDVSCIPFSFFCSLIREISKIRPTSPKTRPGQSTSRFDYAALQIFRRWVTELRKRFSPLPPNTTAICFRLLFPEEDIRRRYDMQEARMVQMLADCFGVDIKVFEKWSLEEASGCLGQELKIVLERTSPHEDGFDSTISIAAIDELLDELAAKSGYSHKSVRSKYPKQQSRPRSSILRTLFRNLSPEDASVLTQIILKDLRPLMYPLTEFHYTTALTKFNASSVKMLTKEHAMDVWDPSRLLSSFYRMRSSLDEAAAFFDNPPSSTSRWSDIRPTIASPVAIPKSEKAQGCGHALEFLHGSSRVWAETKYDGERAQIHVEIRPDGTSSHITIFSKSKRDSTNDRHGIHNLIRSALGLDGTQRPSRPHQVTQNVILDAEMVAFRGDKVDEFWRIRQLIEDTAYGIRGKRRSLHGSKYEHESMNSEANEDRILGLVFFDVIYLNSEPLHGQPYSRRREILEDLIRQEPGKVILADRYSIEMTAQKPELCLQKIFSEHIADHQEGLVLKAEDSRYNDYRKPWVKLKKDYIPGFGDALDMVILGASWEKVRGRILRVPPTTFTTFYVGALESKNEANSNTPKFHAYFTVAYGLTRQQLEEVNFLIKSSDPVPYSSLDTSDLPFTLSILKGLNPSPSVILRTPLVAELFGAGFTKAPHSQHYELRFPRITKVHRPSERTWREATDLEALHHIARTSVGRDRAHKDVDDWCSGLFQKVASPSINSALKRKERTELWEGKLAQLERKKARREISPTPLISAQPEKVPESVSLLCSSDSGPLVSKTNVFRSPVSSIPEGMIFRAPASPIPRTPAKRPQTFPSPPKSQKAKSSTIVLMESAVAWFAKPTRKPCLSYLKWKKRFPREQRLHSLSSLLTGCGWTGDGGAVIKQGVIIIDECDESGVKWQSTIGEILSNIPPNSQARVEIVVLECSNDII